MLVVFGLAVLSNSETAVRPIMGWIAVTMTSLDPNDVARTRFRAPPACQRLKEPRLRFRNGAGAVFR